MTQKTDKGGRPPTYDESYHPNEAYELIVEMGANNAKLARKFHIDQGTINKWLAQHEEFRKKVIEAQDIWNTGEITIALVKRAKGFEFTETTREGIGTNMFVTKKVRKFIAPDTPAIKFALTNMAPKRFAEKKELKVETPDTLELIINTGVKEVTKK
ncbi:MAG: hypothetical protein E3J94_07270 [Desulfobacteraceae bacterium]|nr:MAG: hypothetical protein E3J94_07270 [Desulfobacteraceae bacterium]